MTSPAAAMSDAEVVAAFVQRARKAGDFAAWLAQRLAEAAAQLGGTHELLAGRPGSWEAADVRHLLAGTVGESDEYLTSYHREPR